MKKFLLLSILLLSFLLKDNYTIAQDKVIDKIVAVVGNNIILYSEIESQYLQLIAQGYTKNDITKCQILEDLLFQKLLLDQSKIDSVQISDSQVEDELSRRMRYFITQFGSQDKLEKYYKKSVNEIKDEFRNVIRDQLRIQTVKASITKDIKITPSEVKTFYKKFPEDSLPLINSEVEIGQIVKKPPISIKEKDAAKEKINELQNRILNGENFAALATLYSEDVESAKKGGELGLYKRGELYPEFEVAAFSLKEKEISHVVETKAGYHIIQLIERRGEYINVRHILIRPKLSPFALSKAKIFLDSISDLINNNKITFNQAVLKFSDDPTKKNQGLIINPVTGTSKFEENQLDPNVFFIIDKIKKGEISKPVIMETENGEKAYRILYLKTRTKPHRATLEKDYDKIQNQALIDKQNKFNNKWIKSKTTNTYIKIDDSYKNCNFEHNWVN
jgi:peptidyl-prolyl cis-trans isomerase SurA